MEESVTITLGSWDQHLELLQSKLKDGLLPLFVDGQLEITTESRAGTFMIHCRMLGTNHNLSCRWRQQLASILSEMILENIQSSLLSRVVRRVYRDLDERERQIICRQAGDYVSSCHRDLRRRYVHDRLLDYLHQADILHLEGFINFRLPDYIDELEDAVDRAIDELLIETEYQQFVSFLQYLVETQSPAINTVHVLVGKDSTYKLFDGTGSAISTDEIHELLQTIPRKDIDMDDILISTLIGISPRQLHLHDPWAYCPVETADTLRAVFQRRLHLCRGCNLCERRHRME